MKLIIASLILVLFAFMSCIKCDDNNIKQMREKMMNYATECYKELNITKEEGQKMKTDINFAKTKMRCYSACFMKKSTEMDENNKLNLKTISDIEHTLYPEKADEIIKAISTCIEKVKDIEDECDLANAYDDCVQGNAVKN